MTTRLALLIPESWPLTPECPWALMDRHGEILQLGQSAPRHWPRADEHIAILDGGQTRRIELTIPPARRKDQERLVTYALEAHLARDVEQEHVTVIAQRSCPATTAGGQPQQAVTVLIVNAARLRQVCAQFNAIQRPLAQAVSALECLPPAADSTSWQVFITRPGCAILRSPRGDAWPLDLPAHRDDDDAELLSQLSAHVSFVFEDPRFAANKPAALELSGERRLNEAQLSSVGQNLGIRMSQRAHSGLWSRASAAHSLLHGSFAPRGHRSSGWNALRWPMRVAAAGIAVAIIAVSVNVLILRSDETSLRQRSTHIFAEALPGTPPIMPDRQLRRALDDARRTKGELAPADLLSLLGKYAEATGSVPDTFTYRNDELVIEFPSAADVPTGVIWTAFGLQGRIEDQQLSLGVQP